MLFGRRGERRDTIIDLPEGEKVGLRYIGDSITERLKLQCQVLFVERLVQRQYAMESNSQAGIKCEPLPLNFVAGSKYDFSVVAVFLAQKFGWHIPTYRGQDIFAGCGWAPSRSSINDLFNQADVILAPLFKQMQSLIFKESIVLGDDTTLRLLTRDSLDQDQEQELELRRQRNNPVATRRIKISREVLLAMHGFTTGWTMGLLTTYFTGRLAVVKRLFRRI